jgi:arylsulfatase A-like enzyme
MRRAVLVLTCLALTACLPGEERAVIPPEPLNIILMLTDDQGWQDTSVPFWTEETPLNRRYHTPNLERLAASGMKFTNAYANAVCSPTRVALLTGLNQARTRVSNWTHLRDERTDRRHRQLEIPKWNMNGLQPVADIRNSVFARPLPQILREHGYRTIHIGKGHLGAAGTPGADPQSFGFDVRIGGRYSGGCGSYSGITNFGTLENNSTHWRAWDMEAYFGKDIFLTEALTQEAIKAIRTSVNNRQPFFLYLAHYAPHTPIMPDQRFVQKYLDAGVPRTEAAYASMIEGIDKSMGDLMDTLQELRITDRTVVFFMSDNGGLSHSQRDGVPHTHNAPLNSGKGSAYEGGIRVPMIARWPGVTEPGSLTDTPVIIEDFFPTILEIAQIPFEGQTGIINGDDGSHILDGELDGESFVPLLRGLALPKDRPLFWHFPHAWGGLTSGMHSGPGIGATSTVRKGDWKLVYWHADGNKDLFNLASDIGETENVTAAHPKITADLAVELGSHLRSTRAVMPFRQSTGRPVPYPDE